MDSIDLVDVRRTVTLVIGHHRDTPPAPARAASEGLSNRVALVLPSYRPDLVDASFDAPLFCAAANAVTQALGADYMEVISTARSWWRALLGRREDTYAIPYFFATDWADEPPEQVQWYKEDALVAVGVSELWVSVGGPEPYHDSYTFSWFLEDAHRNAVLEALQSQVMTEGTEAEVVDARSERRTA